MVLTEKAADMIIYVCCFFILALYQTQVMKAFFDQIHKVEDEILDEYLKAW